MNLYLRQPTPGRIVVADDERRPSSPKIAILQASACFGLFDMFSGNSKTNTTNYDNRIAATDSALVNSDKVEGEGVLVRDSAKIISPGGVDNSGTLTISSDPAVIQSALQSVEDVTQSVTNAAQAGQQNLSNLINGAFSQLSTLAESKQTQGESQRNKTILWIVLGLFLLLAIVAWRKR